MKIACASVVAVATAASWSVATPALASDVKFSCEATRNGIGLQILADNPTSDRLKCTATCAYKMSDTNPNEAAGDTSFTATDAEVPANANTQIGAWYPSHPGMTWSDPKISSSSCSKQ